MAGPSPLYQPTFTAEQIVECERVVRRPSAPHAVVCRATLMPNWTIRPRGGGWANTRTGCATGVGSGPRRASGSTTKRGAGARPLSPPVAVTTVKALACEVPAQRDEPLSRYSTAEFARLIAAHADAPPRSRSTIWRILDRDALTPWRFRSWVFPRDPAFAEKAGRVLDLYAGMWEGQLLSPDDCVLSADEKTSIQARLRCHASLPPVPGYPAYIEHAYERGGALAYLAAWDVRRGQIQGRCEDKTGKAPFGRLVDQVMRQEPYRSAPRVFWIVDNGSSHRGHKAAREREARYSNLIVVHLPTHASWLNQVEIYVSIIQRKVLTPNDFADLAEVERRLLAYENLYNATAHPFAWQFTRQDLAQRLAQLDLEVAVAPLRVDTRRFQFGVPQMPRRRLQVMRLGVQARPRAMAQRMHASERHPSHGRRRLEMSPRAPRRAVR